MKKVIDFLKFLLLIIILADLSACGTPQVIHDDHYTAFTPDDTLLQDYDVEAPPMSSQSYSTLTSDEKETMWVQYTNDLLVVIKRHMADKAGLRKAKEEIVKKVDDLNKQSEKQK